MLHGSLDEGIDAMSRDMLGGAILVAGLWVIVAVATTFSLVPPRAYVCVVTASEKMNNRPDLVRAAPPAGIAAISQISGGGSRVPQG